MASYSYQCCMFGLHVRKCMWIITGVETLFLILTVIESMVLNFEHKPIPYLVERAVVVSIVMATLLSLIYGLISRKPGFLFPYAALKAFLAILMVISVVGLIVWKIASGSKHPMTIPFGHFNYHGELVGIFAIAFVLVSLAAFHGWFFLIARRCIVYLERRNLRQAMQRSGYRRQKSNGYSYAMQLPIITLTPDLFHGDSYERLHERQNSIEMNEYTQTNEAVPATTHHDLNYI